MKKNKASGARYLFARLTLIKIEDLFVGRFFRYGSKSKEPTELVSDYHNIAGFVTKIKWRPELGVLNENRIDNMERCCDYVSGFVLMPGQYMSLMKLIGNPTEEKGFKDGPMLLNGELKYTSGGGVCQVSTTVFNAALLSGLKIVKKWNHTWDVWGEDRFIDLGRDATYAYGRRDLIIQNTYEDEVGILMSVDRDNLELKVDFVSIAPIVVKANIEANILEELGTDVTGLLTKGYRVHTKCICDFGDRREMTYSKEERYKPRFENQ